MSKVPFLLSSELEIGYQENGNSNFRGGGLIDELGSKGIRNVNNVRANHLYARRRGEEERTIQGKGIVTYAS